MPVIIQICCENLVMPNCVRRIYYNIFMVIKKVFILITQKVLKHRAIFHVMPVNHCIRIFKIFAVIIFGKYGTFCLLLSVDRMVQVISVISFSLKDWIINVCVLNLNPCIYFRILFLQCRKINWDFNRCLLFYRCRFGLFLYRLPHFFVIITGMFLLIILVATYSRTCNCSHSGYNCDYLVNIFLHKYCTSFTTAFYNC